MLTTYLHREEASHEADCGAEILPTVCPTCEGSGELVGLSCPVCVGDGYLYRVASYDARLREIEDEVSRIVARR